jgi:hypothetical protein
MKLPETLAVVAILCGCCGMGLITAFACEIVSKPANIIAAGLVIVAVVIAAGLALTRDIAE